jgi:hypothetical protein
MLTVEGHSSSSGVPITLKVFKKTGGEPKFPLNRALNSLENALELVGLGVSAEERSAPEKLGHDAAA